MRFDPVATRYSAMARAICLSIAMDVLHDRVLRLARSLQASSDIVAWSASFKRALEELMPEVDRISVNVNRNASDDTTEPEANATSTMYVFDGAAEASVVVSSGSRHDAEYFLASCRRSGFPVSEFRRPICLGYVLADGSYCGSIVLWQRLRSPELEEADLSVLRELAPFITYLFASAIERYQAAHRHYVEALRAASTLIGAASLTRREREVFLCRFQGLSVGETAERLSVSEATVRRHIRAIGARLRELESPPPETLGLPFARLQQNLD